MEAATQTPWAVTAPQYPQKYNTDTVAVFGTTRTIASHAYPEEYPQALPEGDGGAADLPGARSPAIEEGAPDPVLDDLVRTRRRGPSPPRPNGAPPHRAILGCTHYPLVEHLFRRHLPPFHAAHLAAASGGRQP